jgi:hypothetical protein
MMRMPAASKWVLCACLPWGLSVDDAHAQDADPPVAVADRHDTANAFLELLEEDERAAALRLFDHDSRHGWSFFPVKRDALRIGDLDAEERAALDAFLRVALSEAGRAKLADVLVVEAVSDRGGGVVTGPEEYHVRFFGPVSRTGAWSWRLEGHHVALNQTLVDGRVISATPSFLGSAPIRNREGLEPLRREIGIAQTLTRSLEPSLRDQAVVAEVPREIVSGMTVEWAMPKAKGVTMASLPEPGRALLRALAAEHVAIHADDVSRPFFESWDATAPDQIRFAWFGSLEKDGPHAYRLQGPGWVMEYVNFQAGATHVHTVWRNREGEFIPIAGR